MRTLALLAALLLLAFQARAELLQETADQVPTQDQPETEDQDMAISFTEEEHVAQEPSGTKKIPICHCREKCRRGIFGIFGFFRERLTGNCTINGHVYNLCCR
ncbi:defensin alpha 4-like [Saccopteryx leptura]|uniref:defensin alpha 4-like n=1 Tax=Saccopteryx leptura TaxID=249018 RepID=UPI00339C53EE